VPLPLLSGVGLKTDKKTKNGETTVQVICTSDARMSGWFTTLQLYECKSY